MDQGVDDARAPGFIAKAYRLAFWKSVNITVPSVVISIVVGSVNGYALANWRFKGSEFFFTILLVGIVHALPGADLSVGAADLQHVHPRHGLLPLLDDLLPSS